MEKKVLTTIYSAYELDDSEIELIKQKFPFIQSSEVKNVVDRSILAGVRIHHGAKIIDLSLKNKLSSLKKKLYES